MLYKHTPAVILFINWSLSFTEYLENDSWIHTMRN